MCLGKFHIHMISLTLYFEGKQTSFRLVVLIYIFLMLIKITFEQFVNILMDTLCRVYNEFDTAI